jgi:simple sugar transport system ATP-binding protein
MAESDGDIIIRMRDITKAYRGVPAIKNINFDLRLGEVHAILGENGAGKSTLTKIMAGVAEQTSGVLEVNGDAVVFKSPSQALAAGVTMVFQETSLVLSMTVAQNLYLGQEKAINRLRGLNIAAQQFLQSLNFNVDPMTMVSSLGAAKKQMVEIARAVLQKAKVIIFDEPTATLTPEEKMHFFALIERLKKAGTTIVFISHALEEALAVADRITILRDGEHVVTDFASAFDRAKIINAMVGRTFASDLYKKRSAESVRKPGQKILSVQNLSMGSIVRNNSFSVFEGQITGMFGLIGSGRTETAKIISGVLKRNIFFGGEIRFGDKPVRYRTPRSAVRDGIVYVTEDRKIEGFFETMSIAENLHTADVAAAKRLPMVIRLGEMQKLADQWRSALSIRSIDSNAKVIELSGGNQQKVVIAKALVQRPRLIIFDEPTRGVDVGAIAEIHQLINRLADDGHAVIVISSYLPEILNVSDRILVTRQGKVVEEFLPSTATQEKIMYAAVH